MNDIFGPMSSNYCNIFLILSAIYLVFTLVLMGTFFIALVSKKTTLKDKIYMIAGFLTYLLLYITHRIFYNMCKKTA